MSDLDSGDPVMFPDILSEPEPAIEAPQSDAGAVRRQLMEQFEHWVDRMLAGEPPPEGLPHEILAEVESAAGRPAPPEDEADLYSLFSALTTLSGEIRLQGRAFKQLTDAIAPLSALPLGIEQLRDLQQESADRIDQLVEQLQPSDEESAESSLPASREMLGVLMDLYDRMNRGRRMLESAAKNLQASARRGWRRWLRRSTTSDAAHALAGLLESYVLTMTRLEDALAEWGVERIGLPGESFDPERMTAIDVAPANGMAEGSVLDVYRTGYAVRGTVLATARVKVARGN